MSSIVEKINSYSDLNDVQKGLLGHFDALKIAHTTYRHPAVFTVEEGVALNLRALIPGQGGKSLFLTDGKKDGQESYWLVVARDEVRVDLKKLAVTLGAKRFSFAKPEKMIAILGVTPGSATPFAVINDHAKCVTVVLDEGFQESAYCVFHPLENIYSTVMPFADLRRFLEDLGYQPLILPVA